MIVRVMGQGQWVLEPDDLLALNSIDSEIEAATQAEDQPRLAAALEAMLAQVQEVGSAVPDDLLVESDLVLPDVDSTVAEVAALLTETSEYFGLIPDSVPDGSSTKS